MAIVRYRDYENIFKIIQISICSSCEKHDNCGNQNAILPVSHVKDNKRVRYPVSFL